MSICSQCNDRCYNCSCCKLGKHRVNCLRKDRCQNSLALHHTPGTSMVIHAPGTLCAPVISRCLLALPHLLAYQLVAPPLSQLPLPLPLVLCRNVYSRREDGFSSLEVSNAPTNLPLGLFNLFMLSSRYKPALFTMSQRVLGWGGVWRFPCHLQYLLWHWFLEQIIHSSSMYLVVPCKRYSQPLVRHGEYCPLSDSEEELGISLALNGVSWYTIRQYDSKVLFSYPPYMLSK